MLKSNALRAACALVVLVAVSVVLADKPVRKAPVRGKGIIGAKVSVRGGTQVGVVEDVVLTDEGVVDYLIVSRSGKLVTVPWEAAKFDYGKRVATVEVTKEQFEKVPTYTEKDYPDFYATEYRTDVYKAYGMKPGQARRLERRLERRDR